MLYGRSRVRVIVACLIVLFLIACNPQQVATPVAMLDEALASGLSPEESATLDSLVKVDDYPLYTMHYIADYTRVASGSIGEYELVSKPDVQWEQAWGCSLFTTLWSGESQLYGRNFDWRFSPAMLLFTTPSDGYASVAMVDIAYLVPDEQDEKLADLPISEREALLEAPFWPFDGLNEMGLSIGMAAVPESEMPFDPTKETIDSLRVIREVLDHAADVDEALSILTSYNIEWSGGPALHYLIADQSGRAVLAEFFDGELVLLANQAPWHLATNHLRANADENNSGCRRYDLIENKLAEEGGRLTSQQALDLLSDVSWGDEQMGTQWSVVYDMYNGEINVVMGRQYKDSHAFQLPLRPGFSLP